MLFEQYSFAIADYPNGKHRFGVSSSLSERDVKRSENSEVRGLEQDEYADSSCLNILLNFFPRRNLCPCPHFRCHDPLTRQINSKARRQNLEDISLITMSWKLISWVPRWRTQRPTRTRGRRSVKDIEMLS